MSGNRQRMVLVVVAIQIGDLEFDFEDGGLEGQKNFPVACVGCYFLIGVGIDDCPFAPPKGSAGVAGLVLSFLGFFCSRLLRN